MYQFADATAFLAELINGYFEDALELLAAIHRAVDTNNGEALRRTRQPVDGARAGGSRVDRTRLVEPVISERATRCRNGGTVRAARGTRI